MAEGVGESCSHEVIKALAFFVSESCGVVIGGGAGEVDFFVCNVEVTADEQGLFLFELFKVGEEIAVPDLSVVEAFEFGFRVRCVDGDEDELFSAAITRPSWS